MLRIIVLIFVGFTYSQVITGGNVTTVAVDSADPEVIDAVIYAFGANESRKEIELVEGEKRVNKEVIYKLKVKISYYNDCNDNETSIWVIQTDKGCKTTSFCTTEVTKLEDKDKSFKMDSLQCIA